MAVGNKLGQVQVWRLKIDSESTNSNLNPTDQGDSLIYTGCLVSSPPHDPLVHQPSSQRFTDCSAWIKDRSGSFSDLLLVSGFSDGSIDLWSLPLSSSSSMQLLPGAPSMQLLSRLCPSDGLNVTCLGLQLLPFARSRGEDDRNEGEAGAGCGGQGVTCMVAAGKMKGSVFLASFSLTSSSLTPRAGTSGGWSGGGGGGGGGGRGLVKIAVSRKLLSGLHGSHAVSGITLHPHPHPHRHGVINEPDEPEHNAWLITSCGLDGSLLSCQASIRSNSNQTNTMDQIEVEVEGMPCRLNSSSHLSFPSSMADGAPSTKPCYGLASSNGSVVAVVRVKDEKDKGEGLSGNISWRKTVEGTIHLHNSNIVQRNKRDRWIPLGGWEGGHGMEGVGHSMEALPLTIGRVLEEGRVDGLSPSAFWSLRVWILTRAAIRAEVDLRSVLDGVPGGGGGRGGAMDEGREKEKEEDHEEGPLALVVRDQGEGEEEEEAVPISKINHPSQLGTKEASRSHKALSFASHALLLTQAVSRHLTHEGQGQGQGQGQEEEGGLGGPLSLSSSWGQRLSHALMKSSISYLTAMDHSNNGLHAAVEVLEANQRMALVGGSSSSSAPSAWERAGGGWVRLLKASRSLMASAELMGREIDRIEIEILQSHVIKCLSGPDGGVVDDLSRLLMSDWVMMHADHPLMVPRAAELKALAASTLERLGQPLPPHLPSSSSTYEPKARESSCSQNEGGGESRDVFMSGGPIGSVRNALWVVGRGGAGEGAGAIDEGDDGEEEVIEVQKVIEVPRCGFTFKTLGLGSALSQPYWHCLICHQKYSRPSTMISGLSVVEGREGQGCLFCGLRLAKGALPSTLAEPGLNLEASECV